MRAWAVGCGVMLTTGCGTQPSAIPPDAGMVSFGYRARVQTAAARICARRAQPTCAGHIAGVSEALCIDAHIRVLDSIPACAAEIAAELECVARAPGLCDGTGTVGACPVEQTAFSLCNNAATRDAG